MPRVTFFGGPYDGQTFDMPFTPVVLIGEEMDGHIEKGESGSGIIVPLDISKYIYHLKGNCDESGALIYTYRTDYPASITDWLGIEPLDNDDDLEVDEWKQSPPTGDSA